MADCRLVDGVGNHITFVFGDGAQRVDECDRRRFSHGERES